MSEWNISKPFDAVKTVGIIIIWLGLELFICIKMGSFCYDCQHAHYPLLQPNKAGWSFFLSSGCKEFREEEGVHRLMRYIESYFFFLILYVATRFRSTGIKVKDWVLFSVFDSIKNKNLISNLCLISWTCTKYHHPALVEIGLDFSSPFLLS